MARLKKGDRVTDFQLLGQDGQEVNLVDYRGRKILLFFYPRAGTTGCTLQAQTVRDALKELGKLNVAAIGVSPDDPDKQKRFDERYGLGYPLLSDPDHTVAEAFGAWGEKTMMGRKVQGIIRSSFLIDEEGRVMGAWYGVKPADTVPKALEVLKGKAPG